MGEAQGIRSPLANTPVAVSPDRGLNTDRKVYQVTSCVSRGAITLRLTRWPFQSMADGRLCELEKPCPAIDPCLPRTSCTRSAGPLYNTHPSMPVAQPNSSTVGTISFSHCITKFSAQLFFGVGRIPIVSFPMAGCDQDLQLWRYCVSNIVFSLRCTTVHLRLLYGPQILVAHILQISFLIIGITP